MNYGQRLYCFSKDEKGAELAEYAVGVALLVVIGLIVYKVLGNSINDSTSGTAAKVDQASSTSFP